MSTTSLIPSLARRIAALTPAQRDQLSAILSDRMIARPAGASPGWTPGPAQGIISKFVAPELPKFGFTVGGNLLGFLRINAGLKGDAEKTLESSKDS